MNNEHITGRNSVQERISSYFNTLADAAKKSVVTDIRGKQITSEEAWTQAIRKVRDTHEAGNKIMFIGNGGSAGISSHMAIDYSKNGNLRSIAFNDGAALTCLSNDLGYENVFAKQIDLHARPGDLLMAISSSGKSPNILKAVETARPRGCSIYTFSGFTADNPLRGLGDLNFYVNSMEYGFVEITHLTLLHSILDLEMGWGKNASTKPGTAA